MIKGVVFFAIVWLVLYIGIDQYRKFTKQEKFEVIQQLIYAFVLAIISLSVLTVMVFLF